MTTTADSREPTPDRPYCDGVSCAAEIARAVSLLAGRWSVPVLEALHFAGPIRFRELQRRVGTISQKELSRQLSAFVHHSVVRRKADAGKLMRVEYELTMHGRSLLAHMDMLGKWSKAGQHSAVAGDAAPLQASALRATWVSPLLDSTHKR